MTLPAWRPLKDAPVEGTILARLTSGELARATAAVVHVGRDYDGSGGWPEAAWVNEDTGQVIRDDDLVGWLPIADTYSRLLASSQQEHLATFAPPKQVWVKKRLLREANESRQRGLRAFASILHTSMGGRIPDEVP